MLLRREEVVGELEPPRDLRVDEYASVEAFRPTGAGRAVCPPPLTRSPLDPLALARSAAGKQQHGGEYDAETATPTSRGLRAKHVF